MNLLEQIKTAILRALGRAAKNKAKNQAEGMATEARGIVAGAKDLARTNPLGFGALVLLGLGLLWLMLCANHGSENAIETA